MTEAMPFLQKTILLSYDPRPFLGTLVFFPFVCHNELPAAFRFLWVACISMIFAVNAGFALILAPFLRKNDCVSLMVGEPRRFFCR